MRDHMVDPKKRYYIFIDEMQFVSEIQNPYVDNEDAKITFIDVILGFILMAECRLPLLLNHMRRKADI